jgi:hypothetical protein
MHRRMNLSSRQQLSSTSLVSYSQLRWSEKTYARIFDGIQASLKLLFVLIGVFTTDENLESNFATFERLEI